MVLKGTWVVTTVVDGERRDIQSVSFAGQKDGVPLEQAISIGATVYATESTRIPSVAVGTELKVFGICNPTVSDDFLAIASPGDEGGMTFVLRGLDAISFEPPVVEAF